MPPPRNPCDNLFRVVRIRFAQNDRGSKSPAVQFKTDQECHQFLTCADRGDTINQWLQRLGARRFNRRRVHTGGIKVTQPLLIARHSRHRRRIEYRSLALKIGVRKFGECSP